MKYTIYVYLAAKRNVFDPPWRRLFSQETWNCAEEYRLYERTLVAERPGETVLLGDSRLLVHVLQDGKQSLFEDVKDHLQPRECLRTMHSVWSGELNATILEAAAEAACKVITTCGLRLLECPITSKTARVYRDATRGLARSLDLYLRQQPAPSVERTLELHERAIRRIEESCEPVWRAMLRDLPKWLAERLIS